MLEEEIGSVKPAGTDPVWPSVFGPAQVLSWPSSHRLGVTNPNFGVVDSADRSLARCPLNVSGRAAPLTVLGVPKFAAPKGTKLALHSAALSMTPWK